MAVLARGPGEEVPPDRDRPVLEVGLAGGLDQQVGVAPRVVLEVPQEHQLGLDAHPDAAPAVRPLLLERPQVVCVLDAAQHDEVDPVAHADEDGVLEQDVRHDEEVGQDRHPHPHGPRQHAQREVLGEAVDDGREREDEGGGVESEQQQEELQDLRAGARAGNTAGDRRREGGLRGVAFSAGLCFVSGRCGPDLPLASAGSDMIGWRRVLLSHTLDAARSY